jgi:hypothetical protein
MAKYGLLLFNNVCFQPLLSTLFFTVNILDGVKYLSHPTIGQYVPRNKLSDLASDVLLYKNETSLTDSALLARVEK